MTERPLRRQIERELRTAEAARAAGNQGRARVCARRAAGLAAAHYLARHGSAAGGANAYHRLLELQRSPDLPAGLRRAAARLTARVLDDHTLPHPEDPLDDARLLVDCLIGDTDARGEG